MARPVSRFFPLLLPPAAGVLCFAVSSAQRRAGEPGGAAGGGNSQRAEAVAEAAGGPGARDRADLEKVRRLEARVESAADVAALAGIWKEAQDGFPDGLIKNRLGRRIYGRMLDLDPGAAWAWVRSFPGDYPPPQADFLQVWGARDASAAAAAVRALPEDPRSHYYQIAQGWARADPAGFLKSGTPESWKMIEGQRQVFEKTALTSLADTDLPQALALTPKYCTDDSYAARDVFRKLADRMMEERGVEGALAWARELKDYTDTPRQKLLAEILPALGRTDPERAARELSGVLSHQTLEATSLIAGPWAAKEPAEAVKWAMGMPVNDFGTSENREAALAEIGQTLGPDAAALLKAAGGGIQPEPGLPARAMVYRLFPLLQGTGLTDPARLTAELAAGPPGGQQAALVAASLLQWAGRDAPAAFESLRTLPAELAPLAREVLANDFTGAGLTGLTTEKAAGFLRTLREDPALAEFRGARFQNEVWERMAGQDPQAALTLLEEFSGSAGGGEDEGAGAGGASAAAAASGAGSARAQQAWDTVYKAWAARDPQSAAARALTVPEAQSAAAVGGVVAGWVAFDPMAASVWAEALPPGPGRESAAASLAHALAEVEPSSAFEWAVSMPGGDNRQTLLENALRAWARDDAAEARQALENPALSTGTREHFAKILDQLPK